MTAPSRSKRPEPSESAAFEMVGPDDAAKLLANNDNNRRINERWVADLAGAMESGEWRLNGESIVIASDGSLVDGQHRLLAVVESGCTVPMTVVRGVSPQVYDTIDIGRKRATSDVFDVRREANTRTLSAGIRAAIHMERFGMIHAGSKHTNGVGTRVSPHESVTWLESHPTFRASVSAAKSYRIATRLLSPAVFSYLHYRMTQSDAEAAAEFFARLEDGQGLKANSPIYRLRERLTAEMAQRKRLEKNFRAAIAIKAWNAHKKGASVTLFKWLVGEPFPEIE